MFNDLLFRLRSVLRKSSMDEALDEELQFHLEQEIEKHRNRGCSPEEAERRAKLAFGAIGQTREECREARGVSLLENTVQDLRYALMRRNTAFTVSAMLTLGLGSAAIATVFTLANTLLFRELPVPRASEMVNVNPTRRHGQIRGSISYPDYVSLRNHVTTLTGLAAHYSTAPLYVTYRDRSREVNGGVVSANYFPLLETSPLLGRFFRAEEDSVPDRDRVAIISEEFWRTWCQSSPDAIGSAIKINGTVFTIIGVAAKGFRGVTIQPTEIYIPTMMTRSGYRWCADALAPDCTVFDMIGRLQKGVSVEEARAELATLAASMWRNAPEGENTGATVLAARGAAHPNLTQHSTIRMLALLVSAAGLLLLVCCANLAGLLLARNAARTREFAIRSSLGASRLRLIGQLVNEALLLTAGGGVTGVLFSIGLTASLNNAYYSVDVEGHPLYYNFNLEPGVVIGSLGITCGVGLLLGLIPALHVFRSGLGDGMKKQSASVSAAARPARWLVCAQTAVAVMLVSLAGLLSMSAHELISGTNFDSSHVALMRLRPRLMQYPPEKAHRFHRAVIQALEARPDVESVSMVGTGAVLFGGGAEVSLPNAAALRAGYIEIGPRYFETVRTPVIRGREFGEGDTPQSPLVAIVNETMLRRLWPDGVGIDHFVNINGRSHRVIGIVKDASVQTRDAPVIPYVYAPYWQNSAQVDSRMCVRVRGDAASALPALIREIHRVDPDVPVAETITMQDQMAGTIQSLRLTASFLSYAAALAMFLSAVGLYAALAFSVSRRAKEIGVRLAIGATKSQVISMVIGEGMMVVFTGVVTGLGLAYAASRAVHHLLYGPEAGDVMAYGIAAFLVACLGLMACWFPARRAASVAVVTALREQ